MALALVLNHSALKIGGAMILPNLGGFANGWLVTDPNIKNGWYASLNKPAYNPPNWVFGPVWTSLYSAMGYASYIVWQESRRAAAEATTTTCSNLYCSSLAVYGVHLVVNHAWTPVFFGRHDLKGVSADDEVIPANTICYIFVYSYLYIVVLLDSRSRCLGCAQYSVVLQSECQGRSVARTISVVVELCNVPELLLLAAEQGRQAVIGQYRGVEEGIEREI